MQGFIFADAVASFDFKAQPSLNKLLITELLSGDYLDKKENILLVGNSGTGKSHMRMLASKFAIACYLW